MIFAFIWSLLIFSADVVFTFFATLRYAPKSSFSISETYIMWTFETSFNKSLLLSWEGISENNWWCIDNASLRPPLNRDVTHKINTTQEIQSLLWLYRPTNISYVHASILTLCWNTEELGLCVAMCGVMPINASIYIV